MNLTPTLRQEQLDLDQATVLWFKEDREDWEYCKAMQLFKQYGVWDYGEEEPEWHAIQREARFIGTCMERDKDGG